MSDFQSEFDDATNTINNTITTQLSSVLSWSDVPGSLVKASSSAAGYVWGYNSSYSVYMCQLPCSGNWKAVQTPSITTIQDIATDESNVYILAIDSKGSNTLLINSANNDGSWLSIPIPISAVNVFVTHSYVWVQDANNGKRKCAKPCTMPNWTSPPTDAIKIVSASASALYGKDGTGNAMKSDETLQTGWSPISSLQGTTVLNVIGESDQTALYAVDKNSKLLRATDSGVTPIDTKGFTPANITVDPTSKQLWMTTDEPGPAGNIFTRLDRADYSNIMDIVNPVDKQREQVISNLKNDFTTQTNAMTVNKQVTDVVSFFKNIFAVSESDIHKANNAQGHLQEQIYESQTQLDQISQIQPLIIYLVITLLAVCVVYLAGSYILGSLVHVVALAVIGLGVFLSIKFSQTSNNG